MINKIIILASMLLLLCGCETLDDKMNKAIEECKKNSGKVIIEYCQESNDKCKVSCVLDYD